MAIERLWRFYGWPTAKKHKQIFNHKFIHPIHFIKGTVSQDL